MKALDGYSEMITPRPRSVACEIQSFEAEAE